MVRALQAAHARVGEGATRAPALTELFAQVSVVALQLAKAMKAVGALTVAAADCDANKQIGAAYELKGASTIAEPASAVV